MIIIICYKLETCNNTRVRCDYLEEMLVVPTFVFGLHKNLIVILAALHQIIVILIEDFKKQIIVIAIKILEIVIKMKASFKHFSSPAMGYLF